MSSRKTITYCKSCKRETNHIIRVEYKPEPVPIEETGRIGLDEYYIVQCQGCDHIGFHHRYQDPDAFNQEGIHYWFEKHFPEDPDRYADNTFLQDEEHDELPRLLYDIYNELKIAFRGETDVLAGVALRMVVEAVCLHQKFPGRNLKAKISKLFDNGLISNNDYEVIDKLREIGNVSAHQIKSPSGSDLEAALEAVNHLLRTVYIVANRTKRLRKKES